MQQVDSKIYMVMWKIKNSKGTVEGGGDEVVVMVAVGAGTERT